MLSSGGRRGVGLMRISRWREIKRGEEADLSCADERQKRGVRVSSVVHKAQNSLD